MDKIAAVICYAPCEGVPLDENPRLGAIGQPGGHADRSAPAGHIALDHRARADFGEVADAHITHDHSPRTEQDASADSRRTGWFRLVPADGDVLQDRRLVAHDGKCADDDAGGMIEEYRSTVDAEGWMLT